MDKMIIKNVTNVDIEIDELGITVPANEVYYLEDDYKASPEFDSYIDLGSIVFCNVAEVPYTPEESQAIKSNISVPVYEQGYSKQEVDAMILDAKSHAETKVAELTNGSPELLNTLVEISNALGNDSNFAQTITDALAQKSSLQHNHLATHYTKTENNALLGAKANTNHNHLSSHYTKTEVNNLLAQKANSSHTHSEYASSNHTHSEYASSNHNHDADYAPIGSSGGGSGVFGSNYAVVYNKTISTYTNSNAWSNKTALHVDVTEAGYYRIGFTYLWNCDYISTNFMGQMTHNGIELYRHVQEPTDVGGSFESTGTDQRYPLSHFDEYYLDVGHHEFRINYKPQTYGKKVSIWDCTIEFWRTR